MALNKVKEFSSDELHEFTNELRKLLAEEAKLNPDKYSEIDLKRIREDDEYCERFLKHDEDKNTAFKNSKTVLQWRKSYGVNDIKFSNIDPSIFQISGTYNLGRDKSGSENLHIIVKLYKMREIDVNELQRMITYWFEYMDKRSEGKQMNLVMYANGGGLSNVDMGYLRFLVPCLTTYFPHLIKYVLVYEMPWILNAIWKIIRTWMNEKIVNKVKFVDEQSIKEYLDDSALPVFMGGTNTFQYVYPHEDP